MGFVEDHLKSLTGQTGEDKAIEASELEAASMQEATDYLQQQQAPQKFYQQQAMSGLASLYGLTPYDDSGQSFDRSAMIESLKDDPFYQESLARGEEAVLRGQSATGGLRSGASSDALARASMDALRDVYTDRVSGLSGLAYGTQTYDPQIAQMMAGEGQILGEGIIGGEQARAAGHRFWHSENKEAAKEMSKMFAFSDPRLKKNIEVIGSVNGFNWCSWTWNKHANKLGLYGSGYGVMADQVAASRPDLVTVIDEYMAVNYEGVLNG